VCLYQTAHALGRPLAPASRAVDRVANRVGRAAPDVRVVGIPVTEVHFSATDGVRLAHWLGPPSGIAAPHCGNPLAPPRGADEGGQRDARACVGHHLYMHVLPTMQQAAAEAMEALFRSGLQL
jgi:hypothetical protein